MTTLSNHFSLAEMTQSATAKRLGIDNTASIPVIANLKALCTNILEIIRMEWGEPIIVNSGFRCEKLNKAVGGAKTSDHIYGNAADIRTLSNRKSDNFRLFTKILELRDQKKIKFGQLIDEHGYSWIHISNQTKKHRNEVLHIK